MREPKCLKPQLLKDGDENVNNLEGRSPGTLTPRSKCIIEYAEHLNIQYLEQKSSEILFLTLSENILIYQEKSSLFNV